MISNYKTETENITSSSEIFLPEGMGNTRHIPHNAQISFFERALAEGTVLEAVAGRCNGTDMSLSVDLGRINGVIPKEEITYSEYGDEPKNISVVTRVGKPVCFTVLSVDKKNNSAVLSRKNAQRKCFEEYISSLECGDIIKGKVTHLDPFGAFVDIGCGITALITIDSVSVSRISHARDRFVKGQEIYAIVKNIDSVNGRIFLSHRELLGTWEENIVPFEVGSTVAGWIRSIESYGIFVELTPNLAGLAELCDGVKTGERCSVYIKSIIREKMKVKLSVVDSFECEPETGRIDYFTDVENTKHIDYWRYSPEGAYKTTESYFG